VRYDSEPPKFALVEWGDVQIMFLAFVAVGLVQHGVIHAQGAAFHVHERTRFLEQVPASKVLAVQESVGRIVGKRPAGHFGLAHSSPHPAVRPKGKPCNVPGCIWPSRACLA
jgi:hypothetical protein